MKINTPYPEDSIRSYSRNEQYKIILEDIKRGPYSKKSPIRPAAKKCFMELNELMELRDEAYENTQIYKERTKKWHDSRLRGDKNFKEGDKVLIFNSRFKMHPGKLKSKWHGPCVVKTMHPYGTIEIIDKNRVSFKVNGHRLKKYHDGYNNVEEKEVVELDD
ncbi:hypothetical protein Tco_1248288 [Tanacetum coccineum]